jgi:hypothetical protein
LSQTLKEKDHDDIARNTALKEKTISVSEISRHSYFRKSKSRLAEVNKEDDVN